MKIQAFNNWNTSGRARFASFWEQELDPAFYAPKADKAPRTYRDLFDEEFLNSCFFLPEASFWAVENASDAPTPVACLVAAAAPTDDVNAASDAALFGPFFASDVADAEKEKVARALIEATEQKLRERGFERVYAGGAPPRANDGEDEPTGSPLLNGVYGVGSPIGFFDADPARQYFVDAGYEEGEAFVERRIDARALWAQTMLPPGWIAREAEPRRAPKWRLATIERNFPNAWTRAIENVAGNTTASLCAYELRAVAPDGQTTARLIVPRLRVAPECRGRQLEATLEALIAETVADANGRTPPGTRIARDICVVVPEDGAADQFLDNLDFTRGRRATALVKTL